MKRPASIGRSAFALLLMLVMVLAGTGRGWSAAWAATEGPPTIEATLGVPICHSGLDDKSQPVDSRHGDCCDACALCAPMLSPAAPKEVRQAGIGHAVRHALAPSWEPALPRARSPRQAQGPPAA